MDFVSDVVTLIIAQCTKWHQKTVITRTKKTVPVLIKATSSSLDHNCSN